MIQIEKIKEQPEDIIIVFVEAILMPNGEVISLGKTIGWYREHENNLFVSK